MRLRPERRIFLLRINRFIDPFLQGTCPAFGTAVAHIGRFAEETAFFSREFCTQRIAEPVTVPAFFVEASLAEGGDLAFITFGAFIERHTRTAGSPYRIMVLDLSGNRGY